MNTQLITFCFILGTLFIQTSFAAHNDAYAEALASLNFTAVKLDIEFLLTDSQSFWPADYGHYGGLFIRLAWHCAGSYRTFDGRGGCDGGRIRFDPESSWMDNGNLDMARMLLEPIKVKYGLGLSYGDLFILAGTVAIENMGGPYVGFCAGRIDDANGDDSVLLGPNVEQDARFPCEVDGDCKEPLGPTTLGLIYVNPEGPMGVPTPAGSAPQIRDTFARMGMNDRETVALVGGGHAFGKGHGACPSPCGDNKGNNTITSGFEGPWTTSPTSWSNQYFTNLFDYEWEVYTGPGGKNQWRNPNVTSIMMLTADLALINDTAYRAIASEFAGNLATLSDDFGEAWYKLVSRDMGPHSRCTGPWVPPAREFQYELPAPSAGMPDFAAVNAAVQAIISNITAGELVELAFQCSASFRRTDYLGGCNGARIRFPPQSTWPETTGLDQVLSALSSVQASTTDLTWADLIVYAGTVAVGGEATFCPGRTDATDGAAHEFLSSTENFNSTAADQKYVADLMGLTLDEYVLLQARPRSAAQQIRLGFTGTWGANSNVLSNGYFTSLINNTWVSTGNEYKATGENFYMTQNDINLKDDSEFLAIVNKYAADNALFLTNFRAAWTKLMNNDRFDGPVHKACEVTPMGTTDVQPSGTVEETTGTPTPAGTTGTPTPSPTPSATPSPTPSATPSPTPTPSSATTQTLLVLLAIVLTLF